MTISAISSDYSYFQKYQNQFFGGTISAANFEYLMRKYGIQSSGDSYKDVEALYQAMAAEADTEVIGALASNRPQQSQSTEAQNINNIPWANLMSKVGLSATGELSDDYSAFNSKIAALQSSGALSKEEKSSIDLLTAEASIVFVQTTTQIASQQEISSQPKITGADIKAQLNRLYFFS